MATKKGKTRAELLAEVGELHGKVDELRRVARASGTETEHELAMRTRITEAFLTLDDEEMYHEVLKVLLEAMDSEYGVFGYIDEDGAYVVPSMTRHIWSKCQVEDKRFVFPRQDWGESIWPRAIREKRILHSNEPSSLTPEGHIRVTRNISAPIIHGGTVIGLFQVANKATDYTGEDLALVRNLGEAIAPILHARLEREREERRRLKAEEEVHRLNEELARRVEDQAQAIVELSTPIIQLWDRVVLMPLVGVIDTTRAQDLTENLLNAIVKAQARVAIIDVTGVPMVDTTVAQHFVKTVRAARMLGAEALVTGISPETAQTLVKLGVDLSTLKTCGVLQAGIAEAFRLLQNEPGFSPPGGGEA